MKIVLFGANGFIGKHLLQALREEHEVYGVTRKSSDKPHSAHADLTDITQVTKVLSDIKPEVVINCAGVIDTSLDTSLNAVFTENILKAAHRVGTVRRVVVCSSAGTYGILNYDDLPVKETTAQSADKGYGKHKIDEEKIAQELGKSFGIEVVIARIFNCIGPNMGEYLFVPRVLKQIEAVRAGLAKSIEVNRLDAQRDYVAIHDVVRALQLLVTKETKHNVYNIGSGEPTSNEVLVKLLLKALFLEDIVLHETSMEAEPIVASQANISRLKEDFGWYPKVPLEQIVKEIVSARR